MWSVRTSCRRSLCTGDKGDDNNTPGSCIQSLCLALLYKIVPSRKSLITQIVLLTCPFLCWLHKCSLTSLRHFGRHFIHFGQWMTLSPCLQYLCWARITTSWLPAPVNIYPAPELNLPSDIQTFKGLIHFLWLSIKQCVNSEFQVEIQAVLKPPTVVWSWQWLIDCLTDSRKEQYIVSQYFNS